MGVYSITNNITDKSLNEGCSNIDLNTIKESVYDVNMGAAYGIMAECEANYNKIIKAIGIAEFNAYENTGAEMIYESATFGSFIDKVKEFFVSLINKIGSLVKTFIDNVNSWTKKDTEFLKKYEDTLLKIDSGITSKYSFKGWEFDNKEVANASWAAGVNDNIAGKVQNGSYAKLVDILSKTDDGYSFNKNDVELFKGEFDEEDETIRPKMRGALVGKGEVDDKNLREELHTLFYGGKEKKEITGVNVKECVEVVDKTQDIINTVKTNFKEIEKIINKEIKDLNKLKSDLSSKIKKDNDYGVAVALTNKVTGVVKYRLTLMNMRNTAQMQALKDRNTQARSICVGLLTEARKAKPAGKNESTSFTEGTNFLDAVKII